MIGTEEMSTSTGMDISESFRAEDLSKTDFFDFVTAPDMGIGIGVGVGVGVDVAACVDLQQQQHHQPQHTQQPQHSHNHSQGHQPNTSQTPQQQRNNNNNMTHDVTDGSGGGAGIVAVSNRNGSTSNGGDPTLQGYEFWHQDKDNSRLDSSSIFEDLDRYCWQQQLVTASGTGSVNTSSVRCSTQPSPTSPQAHPLQQHQQQQQQQHQQQHQHQQNQQQQQQPNASSSSSAAGSSSDTISSLETADGQIYTLTVLNGAEPWLKREPEQLPSSLDLDSLLGSFPGYIKSEYPYDDSGFSTDGKDVIVSGADANGLSSISQSQSQQSQHGQTLPSLVTAISLAGGGGGGGVNDLGQQLAQFQNNNNDWHMADHNAEAEQNSAESLLRSALQGKGYAKGLQHMHNGLSLPVVKDDEMRRLLFTPDDAADALGFADSTLSTAQMFEDAQSMGQVGGGGVMSASNHGQHGGNATNIIVDDMFLSLENAFSDDFEKLKRLANEVQQFCSGGNGTPTPGDYSSSDVLMQISPSGAAASAATATHLQPLANAQQQPQQQQQQPPPQPLKPEVSTSTVSPAGAGGRLGGVSKPKKQYKRSNSSINNNNNPSVANNNNNSKAGNGSNSVLGVVIGNGGSSSSSGSASSSSNSPPANCNASGGSGSSGGGSSGGGGGQRKERSLHYCSICSKGFKDKYSVNVHIRTHTGEKPFACSLCGKSFRQKAHLAKHYQTHMTQKNNGSLIKGSSSKHQRAGANAANAAASLAQQRQLSAVSSAVATPSLMSAGVVLSGPNTPPGVLPPANGLLANR